MDISTLIFWVLLPYVAVATGYISAKTQAPAWVVRKEVHIIGLVITNLIITFHSVVESLIIAMLFGATFLLLSAIPGLSLFTFFVDHATRPGESRLVSYLNPTWTVIAGLVLMFILQDHKWIFMTAVFALALGDGFAEPVGRLFGRKHYRIFSDKTFEGSMTVFVGTVVGGIITICVFDLEMMVVLPYLVLAAFVATLIEAASILFIDNVLIPFSVAGILFYFLG